MRKLTLFILTLSLPLMASAQEEVECNEEVAQTAFQQATQNLANALENEYPHLKLDCQINKSFRSTNYDLNEKQMESKSGSRFDYFKGHSVCNQKDPRIRQLVTSSFSFIIEKNKCQVMKMERVQSKTSFY